MLLTGKVMWLISPGWKHFSMMTEVLVKVNIFILLVLFSNLRAPLSFFLQRHIKTGLWSHTAVWWRSSIIINDLFYIFSGKVLEVIHSHCSCSKIISRHQWNVPLNSAAELSRLLTATFPSSEKSWEFIERILIKMSTFVKTHTKHSKHTQKKEKCVINGAHTIDVHF